MGFILLIRGNSRSHRLFSRKALPQTAVTTTQAEADNREIDFKSILVFWIT
jgi:hypothetical protein